jgi:aminoglycoside phosphotransferase family enzyme
MVFFTGDRAYKLKKPVDLGFLDFSTPAAREAACHRKTELNRRFAPDVYLGVAEVRDPAGETAGAQRYPPARPRAHLAAHPALHAARVTLRQR